MKTLTALTCALLTLSIAGCSGAHDETFAPTKTSTGTTPTATGTSITSATSEPETSPNVLAPEAVASASRPRQVSGTTHLPTLTWTAADDPSTVAQLFAQASWQMDTVDDTTPVDAQRRAATFAAPDLATVLTGGGPLGGGGAAWTELTAHAGWTTAEAVAVSAPDNPDTTTVAAREVTVTITAHGSDGWTSRTAYPQQVVYLTLSPAADGGWLVTDTTSAQQ